MPSYDITTDPVFSLGQPVSTSTSWSNTDVQYEWAVDGLPFLSIPSDEFQSLRSFVQVRKDQFDSSKDPGEQSLTGWWLRSQRDFSSGAGIDFLEPVDDERTMRRFSSSYGVDVWTPGRVSLLKAMSEPSGFTTSGVARCVSAGQFVYGTTGTTGVKRFNGTTVSTVTFANSPSWLASNGQTVFALSSGAIEKSDSSGTSVSTIYTGTGITRGWWAKGRLVVAAGSSLYWLLESPPSPPVALSGVTATSGTAGIRLDVGDVPTGFTWTAVTGIPSGILAAGYAGSRSQVYRITITDATGTVKPTATLVADLPAGEQVLSLFGYLGSYVAIGTNKGLRVGIVSDGGTITYGPLTFSAAPVEHVTGKDRFLFCSVSNVNNGTSGVIRVDLSDSDQAGRFAWAYDLSTGATGTVDGVTLLGSTDRVCVGVNGDGIYVESATDLVATGQLTTAQVRFTTLEPKTFQLVSLRADVPGGTIAVESLQPNGTATTLYTVAEGGTQLDVGVSPSAPVESLGLRFTFARGTATTGPTLRGWQFKALPAVTRKQQWRLPLLCFDVEQDRFGNRAGAPGGALGRYQRLRSLLLSGEPVVLQDLVANESYVVLVEDVQFVQTSPPRQASGFGGVMVVLAREL